LAEGFDRARFTARLDAGRLGRSWLVRESTASTNDDAWAALAERGDGAAVIALAQTRGRGRDGRRWTQAPGKGLALSVALRMGGDVRGAGAIPLAAGLAVARAAHALGVTRTRLKWPNDVLVEGRKLAGVLCELRRAPAGPDGRVSWAVVIGIGMNVLQRHEDFPPELRESATSLVLEGGEGRLEDAAAACLNALEPLWSELQDGDRAAVLAAWSALAPHWGARLRVRTPAGEVAGIAQRLDADGGLVLRTNDGRETTVVAGDLVAATPSRDPA
jgi:BirA family biotin operon repressor/biotin-[acetyl-CoA-carboxylase] ligase